MTISESPKGEANSPSKTCIPLLELENVTKRFGGVIAVSDVSLQVNQGEIFGVIGSNGAGKSTLLSLISGSHAATDGQISFKGQKLTLKSAVDAARIGIGRAHQVPRPFPQMTVRQNVDVAARVHRRSRGERRARVADVLDQCGLHAKAERPAKDLGLLDLKRLGVARALALDPSLLLLDEVAAGLVGNEIDDVVELINGIRNSGITIVMVEHVQALIRRLADRVLVLEWGQVLTIGTPAEVAADPDVIAAYLGSSGEDAPTKPQDGESEVAVRPAPILETRDLGVSYGALPALSSCSITVGRGEVVAVVGANGAGKTTLAKSLLGLVPNDDGSITFDDVRVDGMPPHKRSRMGLAICQEGRRLFGEMTIEDNLMVAARRRDSGPGSPQERVERAFELFPEIAERRRSLAGTLSGGQQQMVAIGRALATAPNLVIFDELSLGLAPLVTERILEVIPRLSESGVSVILIEQNVAQALAVSNYVYVLDRGRVSFSGYPRELADDETLREAYFGDV